MTDAICQYPRAPLTRDDMQAEALTIESLLKAAMAMLGSADTEDAFELIEMAHTRAEKLNAALDSVNVTEEAA